MKDLITSIGAIMILMIFVMQFCANQVLQTKVLYADSVVDKMNRDCLESGKVAFEQAGMETYKKELSSCFDCQPSDIKITRNSGKITLTVPMKEVIVCGEFLGIPKDENVSTYKREIRLE